MPSARIQPLEASQHTTHMNSPLSRGFDHAALSSTLGLLFIGAMTQCRIYSMERGRKGAGAVLRAPSPQIWDRGRQRDQPAIILTHTQQQAGKLGVPGQGHGTLLANTAAGGQTMSSKPGFWNPAGLLNPKPPSPGSPKAATTTTVWTHPRL
jgi:hypothetical protein